MNGILYGKDYGMGDFLEFTTLESYGHDRGRSRGVSGMGDSISPGAPGTRLASVAAPVTTLGKIVLGVAAAAFVVTMWPR